MEWPYIAGFIDGDGYISVHKNRGTGTVGMCQAAKNRMVLDAIHEFLASQNILCKVAYSTSTFNELSKPCPMLSLNIRNHISVCAVLTNIIPHLVLKQAKAQQLLADVETKLTKKREYQKQLCQALEDYQNGLSSNHICQKYHIWHTTLMQYIRRNGLSPRTHQEASKLAYAREPIELIARIRAGAQRGNERAKAARQQRLKEVPALYLSGMTQKEIAKQYGVADPTIRRFLVDTNTPLRAKSEVMRQCHIKRRELTK